jgi:hypothetical protein
VIYCNTLVVFLEETKYEDTKFGKISPQKFTVHSGDLTFGLCYGGKCKNESTTFQAKVGRFEKCIRNTCEVLRVFFLRMTEMIIWVDHVRNEETLQRENEERNTLQIIKRRKSKCTGHILRRNCLLKHFTEGK